MNRQVDASGWEWKYTNRDVREDPRLTELAVVYLQESANEFEPLVLARQELIETGALRVQTVRIILNCMRNDYKVGDQMPVPDRPTLSLVVPSKGKAVQKPEECGQSTPHVGHYFVTQHWGNVYCYGVTNGRKHSFERSFTPKVGYAKARTGALIHRPADEGSWIMYWTNQYGPGFKRTEVSLKLSCKYPSRIKNPLLMNLDQAMEVAGTPVNNLKPDELILFCQRCFPEVFNV